MTASNAQGRKPFLYVVVCAAGVADGVGTLIAAAQERHWEVGVIATPQGLGFLGTEAIQSQTGYPIRSAWRTPGETRPLPPADAIAVAPATFNYSRPPLPERRPGCASRLPAEPETTAGYGHPDRLLPTPPPQGRRWRGSLLLDGGHRHFGAKAYSGV